MSKLTLTVDPEVVKQAKIYAASQQQSLSKLVENYLKTLPADKPEQPVEISGTTAELAGIIDSEELSSIENYEDYLQEKYQ